MARVMPKHGFQKLYRELKIFAHIFRVPTTVCLGFTSPFNNIRAVKFKVHATDKCVFRYRQSNVRRLLPASYYCRARGNQIVKHSSESETVLGSRRKLGPVSRKPRRLFGPVKPLQNIEPCDYRAVLFTYSKDEGRFPSYNKFQAYTLLCF